MNVGEVAKAAFLITHTSRTRHRYLRKATKAPHLHLTMYIFQMTEKAQAKFRALLILAFPPGFEELNFSLPQSGSNNPTQNHNGSQKQKCMRGTQQHHNRVHCCEAAECGEIFHNRSPKHEHFT